MLKQTNFHRLLDLLVCVSPGTNTEQEREVQPRKKRYKCCSLLSQGFTTHMVKERDTVKGILLAYSIKKGSHQSEIDHISLKGKKMKKVAFTSNEPNEILRDTLT